MIRTLSYFGAAALFAFAATIVCSHRAHRKFRRRPLSAGAPSQNAMLLIGVDHDQIGDRIAREIANHAIALIDGETRGTAITRPGGPARLSTPRNVRPDGPCWSAGRGVFTGPLG